MLPDGPPKGAQFSAVFWKTDAVVPRGELAVG